MAALVAGEQLDVFEAVGLGADLHGAGDHGEEVDEQAALDQLGQQRLAHAVGAGEAFEGGSFGVVVVVDVHAGVAAAPGGEVVDEGGGGGAFVVDVVGPAGVVGPLACVVAQQETEQEEEAPVGTPEGVAFVVEEDVAVVGCGQRGVAGGARDR